MAHFAEIDKDNIVLRVIVASQEFIDSGSLGDPNNWIQTSYNTISGIHRLGGVPLRKNYAGIGFTYDKELDAFIPPKPFPSWIFNEKTCNWTAPIPYPDTGDDYIWVEEDQVWETVFDNWIRNESKNEPSKKKK